jgi:hypothetical protein
MCHYKERKIYSAANIYNSDELVMSLGNRKIFIYAFCKCEALQPRTLTSSQIHTCGPLKITGIRAVRGWYGTDCVGCAGILAHCNSSSLSLLASITQPRLNASYIQQRKIV